MNSRPAFPQTFSIADCRGSGSRPFTPKSMTQGRSLQFGHSRQDATTARAAMAAVSARTMRGPSDAARQPLASKRASSAGAHPPSGPIAISKRRHLLRRPSRWLPRPHDAAWWCAPARQARCASATEGVRNAIRRVKPDRESTGTSERRACCDASCAMRRQRSARFAAAWARCFSVLRAITGRDRGDAELGCFFDGPLHAIELVDRPSPK